MMLPRGWYVPRMKPRLGPTASLVVAVAVTVMCSGYVWFTADTGHRLSRSGVNATGKVTALHHPSGRFSVDSIDVRIPGYSEDFRVERFSGSPQAGDEIDVRYDPADPSRMIEAGVSIWGPFEYVMGFMGVAGAVSTVVELSRRPRRRRRGTPVTTSPREPHVGSGKDGRGSAWATSKRARRQQH